MTSTETGVRRTERYVYNSLHWAFPILPLAGLAVVAGDAPLEWSLPWLALVTVAAWAGLVVLHTRLREAALLPASGWDAVLVRNVELVRRLWIGASVVVAATAGFVLPPTAFLLTLTSATIGSVLAMPMLGRPDTRPMLVGLTGVAVGQLAVWVGPHPGLAEPTPRVVIAYWSAFATAALLGYAVMFRNVLTSTRELERARFDTARLAVTEERLRFSRDLHDVFGRTLSAVALKAELAAEQARRGRPEAVDTMHEVQSIATRALDEVRAVVRGYRESDLNAEVAGARSLLEASGIDVTTVVDGVAALPAPVARAFAWVVREGTTNILRHADADQARVAVTIDPGAARLVLHNDRPHPASERIGSGLAGLTERLAEVGGILSVQRGDDSFTLTATVDAAALARLRVASDEPTTREDA
ncbi:MAG: histidine kinase [Micropruina sp.]|uniref:sensor histidine kinase n=1 Tax=Micropruina sp. TaxID=2737536 RepID=UPI0039E2BBAD